MNMTLENEIYLRSLLTLSREEIGQRMIDAERLQGHRIVKQAPWFNPDDWDPHTIISQDRRRIRLVALQAKEPGTGAFTRLVAAILAADLIPVVVEPNGRLVDWCLRHEFRSKRIGTGFKHVVWFPRRFFSAYDGA
jgi:hypothetical protein